MWSHCKANLFPQALRPIASAVGVWSSAIRLAKSWSHVTNDFFCGNHCMYNNHFFVILIYVFFLPNMWYTLQGRWPWKYTYTLSWEQVCHLGCWCLNLIPTCTKTFDGTWILGKKRLHLHQLFHVEQVVFLQVSRGKNIPKLRRNKFPNYVNLRPLTSFSTGFLPLHFSPRSIGLVS